MIPKKIHSLLHSGKNSKAAYYATILIRMLVPRALCRRLGEREMGAAMWRSDIGYILDRVDYYCKLDEDTQYPHNKWEGRAVRLKDQKPTGQKVCYYDAMRYGRCFSGDMRWIISPGYTDNRMELPSIVKSRPIGDGNDCSVLMKLNAVRNQTFVNDRKDWARKKDMAVFRGGIRGERQLAKRKPFFDRWFGNPMFDIGVLDKDYPQWHTAKMTIREHLNYKFVMALEGDDVASNLKWVMSSNSIAVMPRPTCETWFMEGSLVPNYHYIEVKPDYSDVEERLAHYIAHPDKARAIISHAHEWVKQFRDRRREKLISLFVLDKYFRITNTDL